MGYSEHTIQQLRSNVKLSEVVRQKVSLIKKGHEYSGLCPFHKEKTPSFTVNDHKEFYHCFGCGAHGDIFDFYMSIYGLAFQEALEKVAQISGFSLPQNENISPEIVKIRKNIHDLLATATQWYHKQLFSDEGKEALHYLQNRGVSKIFIEKFQIGYSPRSSRDTKHPLQIYLEQQQFSKDLVVASGLMGQSKFHSDLYDRLEGRLLFPITDRKGQAIAFGGRVLDDSQPKYLNSAESDLFQKRDILYNIFYAKENVRNTKEPLLVVEGYMDVIALTMFGFESCVAPLGTAFTQSHLNLLWKVSEKAPIFCFDGDQAGFNAAVRVADMVLPFVTSEKNIRFALLPYGEDPDSYLQKNGKESFKNITMNALSLFDILWKVEIWGKSLNSPEDLASIESHVVKKLSLIQDVFLKKQYLQYLKKMIFQASWKKKSSKDFKPPLSPIKNSALQNPIQINTIERKFAQALLCTLVNHPNLLLEYVDELSELTFEDTIFEHIKIKILDYVMNKDLDISHLRDHLKEGEDESFLQFDSSITAIAPFLRVDTESQKVKEGIETLFKSFQKERLQKDLILAENQFANEMSEKNFQYLMNLKKECEGS